MVAGEYEASQGGPDQQVQRCAVELIDAQPEELRIRAAVRYAEGQFLHEPGSTERTEATVEANFLVMLALLRQNALRRP